MGLVNSTVRGFGSKLIVGVIFALSYSIFLTSHVYQSADSKYSMLLSESLLHYGSFTLDHYMPARADSARQSEFPVSSSAYQLESIKGHIYYFYSPGSSVLSVPYVALMNLFGISASRDDGTYDPQGEMRIQASLAALLMALFTLTTFQTSRLLLPYGWSALAAAGIAFGTQVWSTASRALWSHTWGVFLMGLVVWMLLAQETGRRRIRPMLLATLLSWTFFVRPTNCLPVAAIGCYIFIYYRPLFTRYLMTGIVWLVGFVAYSWFHFGTPLPNYYAVSYLSFDSFWAALAGHLVSPSRGLLIFVPVILFVAYLLASYRRELTSLRLVALASAIAAAHLIMISGFSTWWGGHCYGPRYTTELVPWFALLGIIGIEARLAWRRKQTPGTPSLYKRGELVAGGALLACSIVINGLGATAQRTWWWNVRPANVDEHPERVWDWSYPQFLARQDRN